MIRPAKVPGAVWVWIGALVVAAVPPVITEVGQYFRDQRDRRERRERAKARENAA